MEDRIWSFLRRGSAQGLGEDVPPPLASYAPERVYRRRRVVQAGRAGADGRVSRGAARGGSRRAADALRSGGWTAGRFALEAGVRWIGDGTVGRLVAAKRADAAARQRVVAEQLAGFAVRADPCAYYAWWELPQPWRADTFLPRRRRRGWR